MDHTSEQKLVERADFRDFVDQFDDVAVWSGGESGFDYMSSGFEGIYGRPVAEVLEDPTVILEWVHPEDRARVAEVMAGRDERVRNGESIRFDHRVLRPDGECRWVETRIFPVHTPSGEVSEVVGVTTDITDRKERTDELNRTRDHLRAILENTPAVIYMKDSEGRYQYVNPAFERVVGHSREEALGKRTGDVHPDANAERIEAMDNEAFRREEPVEHVEELEFDGERRVYLNTRVPLFDGDCEPYAIYGIATEITEQKKHEESMRALAEAGPRLLECRTTEEIGSVAVSTANSALNLPVTALLEHEKQEGVLRPVVTTEETTDLLGDPAAIERGSGIAWRAYATGEVRMVEDVGADPDAHNPDSAIESEIAVPVGEYGVLLAGSTEPRAFDDHDRKFATILGGMIQSTLDRVGRERQIQAKNERLEEFAGVLAHDLRNPLNIASEYAKLVRETGDMEHLTPVENSIERVVTIVEGLLALARTGQGFDEFEEGTIARLAREAWSSVETEDASLRIETDREITAELGWLQRLFENAFRNSVEHGGPGVTVRVGAIDGGFYVEDDGPGIDPDHRERFLEGDPSEGDVRFGFKVIRDIVDAHGWELAIEEGEAGGARLEVLTG
ncbi:PAS domain-containing sensor histidine kinase [Halalkalicoccus tibetensis]|uniref:histidine kinase n=1 Tax=Halalkalicoccus tibetensis TaxID=175632 RepID=A0ABD5VBS1_9EURY